MTNLDPEKVGCLSCVTMFIRMLMSLVSGSRCLKLVDRSIRDDIDFFLRSWNTAQKLTGRIYRNILPY